jgi:hypothetical protein
MDTRKNTESQAFAPVHALTLLRTKGISGNPDWVSSDSAKGDWRHRLK